MFSTRHYLAVVTMFGASPSLAEIDMSARIDCSTFVGNKASSTQNCLNINSLQLTWSKELSKKTSLQVSIDPFSSPVQNLDDYARLYPDALPSPEDTRLGIIEDFLLTWQFRPSLALQVATHAGVSHLPEQTYLPSHGQLQSPQWQQLALVANYELDLLAGAEVDLVIGNGEGEVYQNIDPQQYGGFRFRLDPISGLSLSVGVSVDANTKGSEQHTWLYGEADNDVGFTRKRLGVFLSSRGGLDFARGLSFTLGWQRMTATDLNKDKQSLPDVLPYSEDRFINPGFLLVESNEVISEFKVTVSTLNIAYRILDQYTIAAGYQTRTITADGLDYFRSCDAIVGDSCDNPQSRSDLIQNQFSVAAGVDVDEGLNLSVEYTQEGFQDLYQYFNFISNENTKRAEQEVVHARLTYALE